MSTTAKGVPYPEETDANDVPNWMHNLAIWLDARPGVTTYTTAERNVLTAGDIWPGRVIFNSTTQQLEINKAGAAGAANWSQLELVDAAAATASLRTLGTGANQAAAGNHTHGIDTLPVAASGDANPAKIVRADDARLSNARPPVAHTHPQAAIIGLDVALNAKAGLNSPAFDGTPTAPTPALGDDSDTLATTAFVQDAIGRWPNKGSFVAGLGGDSTHSGDIVFPHVFAAPPVVILQKATATRILDVKVDSASPPSTTGFRYRIDTIDGSASSANPTIYWVAIGELA